MKTKLALAFLIVLISAGFSGCATASNPVYGEADSGRTILVERGETFVVELPSNPSTGYTWSLKRLNSAIVQQVGSPVFIPASDSEGLVGVGGMEVWTFRAGGWGDARMEFAYQRAWEGESSAVREVHYSVSVR